MGLRTAIGQRPAAALPNAARTPINCHFITDFTDDESQGQRGLEVPLWIRGTEFALFGNWHRAVDFTATKTYRPRGFATPEQKNLAAHFESIRRGSARAKIRPARNLMTDSGKVEAIQVHHLAPRSHEAHSQTPLSSRSMRRLPRLHGAGSLNRRQDRHGCPST